ncbi:SDR family oxidoreductase [uncultured Tateyamaria sp.]|uniref:SDR family oxidoreductase n=1 Tax=uncultured Tateyamaria sp. TaxID=455651 RepID=UPI00263A30C2|nr:SDR family oxidoreductase [uncultured Tateyamaria sp.]
MTKEAEKQIIVVTGASSGFGEMTAYALADAGHTVYASMRATDGHNAEKAKAAKDYARKNNVDLRVAEIDVVDDASVAAGIDQIFEEAGRLDVIVHNAGHMSFGPAEAFTPQQLAQLYDINVLSTQRVMRSALPRMRAQGQGLIVWVSSSSARGGTPPFLSPYFAAKAGMDSLAVSYASELARWGIETAIMVPGAFTAGTNHFAHAGHPDDQSVADAYLTGPYGDVPSMALEGLRSLEPADADPSAVAQGIVDIVNAPFGKRPFRVHVDPSQDGSEVLSGVADRVRAEMFRRIGLEDLLSPVEQAAN